MRRALLKPGIDKLILCGFGSVFQKRSLNIGVETRIFSRTIGQNNSQKLHNRAAPAATKRVKKKASAAFSTSKRESKMQTAPKSKEENGGMNPPAKLERQLTSTFDRSILADPDTTIDYGVDEIVDEIVEESGNEEETNGIKKQASKSKMEEILMKPKKPDLICLTGEATDIGGGHENQDKSMCFRTGKSNEHLVMGVFDGHGKELGALAATVARDYMEEELKKPECINELVKNPTAIFEQLFEAAHNKIKESFRKKIERSGHWEVIEMEQGYLVKRPRRRPTSLPPDRDDQNVHGGTTATVAVLLDSRRLVVANVGDSTALFGGVDGYGNVRYKELSAEHSPESIDEFVRVQKELHMQEDNSPSGSDTTPEEREAFALRFVYDYLNRTSPNAPKHTCPPIFQYQHSSGTARKINESGYYYKNVRSEWATLVTTPPAARYQDALAFTRSLGDLHLHVYGVSFTPEVREYDLKDLHDQVSEKDPNNSSLLLVCTDGVWDNWKYEDIVRNVLSSSLIPSTIRSDNAQKLTDEMMIENLRLARNYFGPQADNMTGIVCLVHSET